MNRNVIESLESRTLLAADLSVEIASTTLADSLVVGARTKPAKAAIVVSNSGDAIDKKTTKGNVVVGVGLRDGDGVITPIGTANVKASKLAKASANAKVKLVVPDTLAEGSYTLVASVDGNGVVTEDDATNNSVDGKAVAVETANADLGVTSSTSLSGSVAAGAAGTVSISVQNLGNIDAKGTGSVRITSTINGVETELATVEKVKLKVKPGQTINLKPVKISAAGLSGAEAQAVIGTSLTTTLLNDDPSNNAAEAGTLTVSPPAASALDIVGLGDTMTFKTTQSGGIPSAGFETGNWQDSNGLTGTYYITRGIASNGLCQIQNSGGTPIAMMVFSFDSGKMKLGGQKLTFGVDQAASIGSVQVAGQTIYFKK